MVREAASADGDFFERAEAAFALWDMQVRERDLAEAVATARATRARLSRQPRADQILERAPRVEVTESARSAAAIVLALSAEGAQATQYTAFLSTGSSARPLSGQPSSKP